MVLAAGYATRLYPLTKDKPKALLEIKGKPILNYILSKIEGVREVTETLVVTNSKFSLAFEQWAGETKSVKPLHVINDTTLSEQDRLGAVGDIHYVIEMEKIFDDFLVVAGDNLFEFSLHELVDFSRQKNSSVAACVDLHDKERVKGKFGAVEIDGSGKIISFEEKPQNPKTSIVSTACYVFKKDDLLLLKAYLKEGKSKENTGDFLSFLAQRSVVHAKVFDKPWFDIGSFEELGRAREEFNGK